MLLLMALFHSFLWLSTISVFFTNSSVDGHLGYFHVLAFLNSTAINIKVYISFIMMGLSRKPCPRVTFLDHVIVLFLNFLKECPDCSP